ncbi:hypothetical protein ACN47E_008924 [Coniothyrium glycines]
MSLPRKNLHRVQIVEGYVYEQNVDIPLQGAQKGGVVRANVYRPRGEGRYPVLVTYGPYGKDIPYAQFRPKQFQDVNPRQKSTNSAWETPDPKYWTDNEYVVVRADERGLGQSPGLLDTMSAGTADCFYDVVEWAAEQPWSNGKVGLLGISYYAGSQWRVAARRPKGLAAIVPWEGMSDYYRDRVRHGGILANTFISRWWNMQVITNQYGRPGKAARNWGPDTLEGDLTEDVLEKNRRDQTLDTARHKFRDEQYYASKEFNLEDIEVPLLSVANWGGILLHLRGNILGYMYAGSKFKYLRCITGRHDLPFYYDQEVEVQRSFLDAFLKGNDDRGWKEPGKVPAVDLVLRQGAPKYNCAEDELATFPRRQENEWPIARTVYQKFHLTAEGALEKEQPFKQKTMSYEASNGIVQFFTKALPEKLEITGHPVLRVSMSLSSVDNSHPTDMDVFVTLRHIGPNDEEVFYTGTAGDPVPIVKGWLRASLRKTDTTHPKHKEYLPYRHYFSSDVQPVSLDKIYTLDIEIWPTNVVIDKGGKLVVEIAGHDTQGSGYFTHNHPEDRPLVKFQGRNNLHFGSDLDNYLLAPVIL